MVSSSSIQYCMKSLPETSTRLPALAKTETPRLRRAAEASTAMPRAPLWENRPNRPAGGSAGASEALRRTSGWELMMPKEFGPITRMPLLRAVRSSSRWRTSPSGPASANPAETTSSARTPAPAQSRTTSSTDSAGTAITARSTVPADVADRGVGRQALDLLGLGVDGVDRPGEAAGEDVLQELVPDRVRPPAGADHRDRLGKEDRAHADRLGAVLAGHEHGLRLLGRGDGERHGDDAVVVVVAHLVAGLGEDRDHLAVLRQDVGHEPAYALLLGDGREVLQQHRPHAAALVGVGDVERHLGRGRVDAVVAGDADDVVVHRRDQRHPLVVVHLGEPRHVPVAQLLERGEEAQVDRLGGLSGVEAADPVGVLGPDRAHVRN